MPNSYISRKLNILLPGEWVLQTSKVVNWVKKIFPYIYTPCSISATSYLETSVITLSVKAHSSKSESIFGTTHTNIVQIGVEILQQNIIFWLFFILLLHWEILTKILLLYKYLQDCIVFFYFVFTKQNVYLKSIYSFYE